MENTYSIPQWMENELGLLMPSQMEILEEVMEGPYDREYYQQVFSKGYFNDPRNENGEVPY